MRHRWVIVGVCVLSLSTVPLFMTVGKNFLPQADQSEFEVTVRLPPGSSLEGLQKLLKQLEADLKTLPGIRNMLTTVGADQRKQVDRGSILVELVDVEQRKESQQDLMLTGARSYSEVSRFDDRCAAAGAIQGAGSTAELQFFLQGPDLQQLDKYAHADQGQAGSPTPESPTSTARMKPASPKSASTSIATRRPI